MLVPELLPPFPLRNRPSDNPLIPQQPVFIIMASSSYSPTSSSLEFQKAEALWSLLESMARPSNVEKFKQMLNKCLELQGW